MGQTALPSQIWVFWSQHRWADDLRQNNYFWNSNLTSHRPKIMLRRGFPPWCNVIIASIKLISCHRGVLLEKWGKFIFRADVTQVEVFGLQWKQHWPQHQPRSGKSTLRELIVEWKPTKVINIKTIMILTTSPSFYTMWASTSTKQAPITTFSFQWLQWTST